MKTVLTFLAAIAIAGVAYTAAQRATMKHPKTGKEVRIPGKDGTGELLFNGWRLTPAGRSIPTEDMILSAEVSPDGKYLAFTNSGYGRHGFHVVDLATEKEIAVLPVDRGFSGLAWTPDGKRVFASGGINGPRADVVIFEKWDQSGWTEGRSGFNLWKADKEKTAVSSITLSPDGKTLYALNPEDDYLYVLNAYGGQGRTRVETGDHPVAARLSADGRTLYVVNAGSNDLAVVDVSDPGSVKVTARIPTESQPNALALSADGRLFVACGNTNKVITIDAKTHQRIETIHTSLSPKAPPGTTPNSVAVSPDGKELYVANADNNNVAVIDISDRDMSRVRGFIPTGWYPTVVTTAPDGKRLIIASGKGTNTGGNNVQRPIDTEAPLNFEHHGNLLSGTMAFVDRPDAKRLAAYTKQVYDNTPYRDTMLEKSESTIASVVPTRVGAGSPIQHVLYILKENRTYDQVLSDLPQGNGDPSLLLFGRDVTPNQHAIAEQFVLLDNLYCSGEVSQDGHPWSTSAYTTSYNQRSWILGYSRHGRLERTREVSEQESPYIWEAAIKKGLSVRAYGYGGRRGLEGRLSETFDQRVAPDQAARARDYLRADRFIEEFRQMERENRVPNFLMMSLGEDHTNGTAPGAFTPKAQVASNDLAVGKIVEAITQSSLWSKFAIFIIQDDAQNGPDHIDSHRTTGFVISPYVRRKTVDSTMYTTVSMLRTMELLLGLPPLTQYDAAAAPMFQTLSDKADLTGFKALPARIDLMAKNSPHAYGAAESAKMNFDAYDQIDEQLLNRILWHSIKGEHIAMPAPVRRAIPGPRGLVFFTAD